MSEHILVVDDNDAIRHTLVFVLRNNGYHVSAARNGQEALTMILETTKSRENHFDLLLTDIQMPVMSGTELMKQLEQHHINMPVLVISGVDDEMVAGKLRKNDRRDFLLKPFDFRELMKRVTQLLADTPRLQFQKSTGYRALEKSTA